LLEAGNPNFSSGEKLTSNGFTLPKLADEMNVATGKLSQGLEA
jgi:hypothetical protein